MHIVLTTYTDENGKVETDRSEFHGAQAVHNHINRMVQLPYTIQASCKSLNLCVPGNYSKGFAA